MSEFLVKLLSKNATFPTKGSVHAAGYDLSSSSLETLTVPANGKALVPTDLSITVPLGTYGRVAPRSGLAWKNQIGVGAGVIDRDYCGPVGVVLFNHSTKDFEVKHGDRIAQLILEKYDHTAVIKQVEDLEVTNRGQGGFGSTGV